MEDELSCPVCLDVLEEASTIPCGHLFCKACIHEYESSYGGTCPVCRQPFSRRSIATAATAQAMVALLARAARDRATFSPPPLTTTT